MSTRRRISSSRVSARRFSIRCALVPLLLAACAVAGCWSGHVYGERGTDLAGRRSGYGYSDVQLDDITWEVSYTMERREDADLRMLYRCAEITDSSGYDYFVASGRFSMGGSEDTTGYRETRSVGSYPTTTSTRVAQSSEVTSSVRIKLFKGTRPEGDTNAYDARSVLEDLGQPLAD